MRFSGVRVGPERVSAVVVFEPSEPWRTSEAPWVPPRMMAALPGLRGHRCDSGGAHTFAQELDDTELAHVLEHAALELMAMAGSPDTLRGETSWDFKRDGQGTFHVSLEYDDDLVCIAALTAAAEAIEDLVAGGEFEADEAVDALREVRKRRTS
jgi:cyanophycin synthetase